MNKGRSKKYNFADPRGQPLIQKTFFFSRGWSLINHLPWKTRLNKKNCTHYHLSNPVLGIISYTSTWEERLETNNFGQKLLFFPGTIVRIHSIVLGSSFLYFPLVRISDSLMYDIDWLTDRRTNGQTDRLPNKLSCLRPNNRPIDWKIEALTGRGMSESLQTCSITRSSWSSSFCSPDYDETHTHKIKTIKKFQISRFLITIRSPS